MWGTHYKEIDLLHRQRFIPTHVGNTSGSGPWSLRRAVHLHACGEHGRQMATSTSVLGSSPRMWGTLQHTAFEPAQVRFIPTHVGNTISTRSASSERSVHPHACGEHLVSNCSQVARCGSSPRMWGTRSAAGIEEVAYRFIPTHVGNTGYIGFLHHVPAVHPHACGEHKDEDYDSKSANGSSPRMWGTHQRVGDHCRRQRFIPTHVGNTGNAMLAGPD